MSITARMLCVRWVQRFGSLDLRRWLAAIFLAIACFGTSFAHEGHDHDAPTPLNLPVAPRVVAVTPDYELVAVVSGEQRLTIFLHHFETGEPVKDATLTVSVENNEVEASRKEDGVFEASASWLGGTEPIDIVFKLTLPKDQDILTGRLDRSRVAAGPAGVATTAFSARYQTLLVAAGALMGGVLLTLFVSSGLARRRCPAEVPPHAPSDAGAEANLKHLRRAPFALVAILVAAQMFAARADAQSAPPLPSVPATMATDQPQRLADGALFVPKATQHLLSIRTMLSSETTAPRTAQLVGAIIADPNSFGRVQSPRPGRIDAPEAGLGFVGKRVEKGDLLGYLIPYIEAADKANIESQIAEADARIVKLRTILSRYGERPGSVPQVKVDEVEGELNALLRKRAELQPSLVAREEIRAPISGVISTSGVVAGQIVETRDVLFEIVDPGRLWIEAIAHDPGVVANLAKAYAQLNAGDRLTLEFVGLGRSLKQQASPAMFKIVETPATLGIGQPVTVILQSKLELTGIVLPASSIVRAPNGLTIAWVKVDAERFEPHTVRFEPLDGQRVVITAGLKPDQRIVTEGATLVNQVR